MLRLLKQMPKNFLSEREEITALQTLLYHNGET